MRDDMFKVIVERPRRGVGYYRTLPNEYRAAKRFKLNTYCNPELTGIEYDVYDEYCSTKLPMRAKSLGWDTKELNENLQPLYRYIAKQVGRRWDDVYSEICANLDSGSTIKQHVRDHLKTMVATKVYRNENGLWEAGKYGPSRIHWYKDFYVEDGILCVPKDERKSRHAIRVENAYGKRLWKTKREIDGVTYEKDDKGVWYRVIRTEHTYMRTYYHGHGYAPTKELYTDVKFRKWTVNSKDVQRLKLNE